MIKIKLFRLRPAQIKLTQSIISHPSSIMETRGTNKDGEFLHRIWIKSTTSALNVLVLQQQASTAPTATQSHLGFLAFFSRVFLLCEGALALGKMCWMHVGLYTTECEGK